MSDEVEVKATQAVAPTASERFAVYARDRAQLEASIVAEELANAQGDAILTATTEEELDAAMQTASLMGLRELSDGTEITIHGFHYAPGSRSEFANRLGIFAVIEATVFDDSGNGRSINLDTGVERVIKYLRMAEAMGLFPVQRRISKTVTGNGEMITLLPLKKRPVKA